MITLKDGNTLDVGDYFYYVPPELHDGTIEKHKVDYINEKAENYQIRFIPKGKSCFYYVEKDFFERENPTCFISYEKAKQKAENQKYTMLWVVKLRNIYTDKIYDCVQYRNNGCNDNNTAEIKDFVNEYAFHTVRVKQSDIYIYGLELSNVDTYIRPNDWVGRSDGGLYITFSDDIKHSNFVEV